MLINNNVISALSSRPLLEVPVWDSSPPRGALRGDPHVGTLRGDPAWGPPRGDPHVGDPTWGPPRGDLGSV